MLEESARDLHEPDQGLAVHPSISLRLKAPRDSNSTDQRPRHGHKYDDKVHTDKPNSCVIPASQYLPILDPNPDDPSSRITACWFRT